jgi:hypothetical protein
VQYALNVCCCRNDQPTRIAQFRRHQFKIAAISDQRVAGRTTISRQHVQIAINQRAVGIAKTGSIIA